LQIGTRVAVRDGAAEDVGEQHQEHDRLEADPHHVLDVGPDLQHAAPGRGGLKVSLVLIDGP
jgi:hypothetical protein